MMRIQSLYTPGLELRVSDSLFGKHDVSVCVVNNGDMGDAITVSRSELIKALWPEWKAEGDGK